jgi:hypothetical protein
VTDALIFVPPNMVRQYWPQIRDRVAELAQLPGEEWFPEDVYHELMGQSGTYLFTTPDVRAFLITQILVSPYSRKLHVWIASNVGDGDRGDFFEQLKSIAAENNCDTITFVSDRAGWKRAFPGIRATTLYSYDMGEQAHG